MRTVPGKKSVSFFDLFEAAASRTEIAVTFLALLELIRMRQIRVFQDGPFAEIEIRGVLELRKNVKTASVSGFESWLP